MTRDGFPILDTEDLPGSVPGFPPHICPICDYDLRGIARRTCPECGHRFKLAEARRAGRGEKPRPRAPRPGWFDRHPRGEIGWLVILPGLNVWGGVGRFWITLVAGMLAIRIVQYGWARMATRSDGRRR
jgi:hypothetical protein